MARKSKPAKTWFAHDRRIRKRLELTLSDEAIEKLDELADLHPSRTKSAVVEDLVLEAPIPRKKEP